MNNITLAFALAAAFAAPAFAQEAPPPAPSQAPAAPEIPQTRGAWMIVPLKDGNLKIQYSSARECEKETARLKPLGLTAVCIWVN